MTADPKPARRVRNACAMPYDSEPSDGMFCPLCRRDVISLTRHHVLARSLGGDDISVNLIWVDGDGTSGCHGVLETRHRLGHADHSEVAAALIRYCRIGVPEIGEYTDEKKWPGWLESYYGTKVQAA